MNPFVIALLSAVISSSIGTWYGFRRGYRRGLDANVNKEILRRQRISEEHIRRYSGISSPSTRAADIRPTASLRSQAEVDEDSR